MQTNDAPRISRRDGPVIWKTVSTTIMTVMVGVMAWICRTIITHESVLAVVVAAESKDAKAIGELQQNGSSALAAHSKDDDTRVANLKEEVREIRGWVVNLQTIPAKIDSLTEGQRRIEQALTDHMKERLTNGNGNGGTK